ncbi:Uncharacterised protein [Mycobacteroides abscessus subsp. abscessus]|uniref:hypothetical protein n=1 Tax=Mycobacteroides abscessus TaxID=36809 RepID=UPI0009D2C105|nr:hypothetical protein [Mycobacteroides abscessus]SLJ23746.1 Uncharacterised protein [Mycobacteroides abscessus subsp. abscessus]
MTVPITFDNPSDISALLNALKTDAAQTPQSPAPDPGAFKQTAGEKQAPLDVEETDPPNPQSEPKPTPEPKSEPKSAPEPKSEPKSAPEPKPAPADPPKPAPTPKPTPSPKPSANSGPPARNWNGTRFGVQMGIPPSAVRNLKGGETVAGIKGLGKAQWGAGQHHSKTAGNAVSKFVPSAIGKGGVKLAARALPVVGSIYSGYAAWQAFKTGDVIGGVLNLVGVIPGPIGWIAMGAAAVWEIGGWGDPYPKWAEPDGSNTYMLPGVAKGEAGVTDADKAITAAQRSVFSFEDGPEGSVWDQNHPVALRLDGANVKAELDAWVTGITSLFAQIDATMQQSGEDYFQRQRQTLQPHFKAMSDLKGKSDEVMTQLKAASGGAGEAYKAVLSANAAIRDQLAEKGKITDQGPATTVKAQLEKSLAQVTEAETKLGQILAETPSPVVNGTTNAPGEKQAPKAPSTTPTPTPNPSPLPSTTPQNTAPKAEAPKTDDTLSKLLNQLGQQAKANTPSTPTSGLGGGSPIGNSGLGGGNPSSGTPLSQTKPETKTAEEPKKLTDEKKPTDRKKEEVKPLTATKPENEKAQVKPETKPQAAPATTPVAAAPAAAGAPTPAQQNAAHAAKAEEKPNTDVDVKGQKTTFPDPKTAKMAQLLSQADATHPKSLADAAAEAGLKPPVPGQDPGKQINPADAKAGDVMVAGDKNYMLLGDGKFYDLTDYKVVGADELPKDMGDRAGYFRLEDPNPGQPGPGQQPPVSGPTTGVAQPVANPTGAQPGPVAGPGAAPAPGTPPAAPGGVPSVGAPGVPKPGQGGGPGNAASTDTGTGRGGPSSGGAPLDPTAVR